MNSAGEEKWVSRFLSLKGNHTGGWGLGERTEGNLKTSLVGEGWGKEFDVFKERVILAGLPGTFIHAQQSAHIQHF